MARGAYSPKLGKTDVSVRIEALDLKKTNFQNIGWFYLQPLQYILFLNEFKDSTNPKIEDEDLSACVPYVQ